MAALRALGGGSILENNMVQSQASAAGTISTVFAVFPALLLIGHWDHFPFLETAGLTAAGGMVGVLFTIPLRRALVTESDLPYPEGVAAAEILRVGHEAGHSETARRGFWALMSGAVVSAIFSFASGGLRLLTDGASATLTLGTSVVKLSMGFSFALLGAGYLVGISGGLAMLLGYALSWLVAVPILTATLPNPEHLAPSAFATSVWVHNVRFIGAGAIALASFWTLGELAGPVLRGVKNAFLRSAGLGSTDRDLSPRTILITGSALLVCLSALLARFLFPFTSPVLTPALFGALFIAIFGFLTAATCGYMAGLVGSSSSPISGIVLIATVLVCSLLLLMENLGLLPAVFSADNHHLAIAFSIAILSAIVASAAISNDNLQDLKTGQLVGASPWRQEAVLLLGCCVGALVVPPILNLPYQAYGFTGALPRPGMDPTHALAAPQPAIIAMISSGIFTQTLDWTMLSIGAGVGAVLIALNQWLRRRNLSLPPLAAGIGIYLPPSVSTTLAIGAGLGWLLKKTRGYNNSHSDDGTMIASGLIV